MSGCADCGTVLDLVDRNADEHAGVTALIDRKNLLNWAQYRHRARAVALALIDLNLERGEVVGSHMVNRAEHVISDVGVLMAGGVPTSFYRDLPTDQLYHHARDCATYAVSVVIVDMTNCRTGRKLGRGCPGCAITSWFSTGIRTNGCRRECCGTNDGSRSLNIN